MATTTTTATQHAETVGRILAALRADKKGLTPSAAARKGRTDTHTAARILKVLTNEGLATTVGNGAWTRWHAAR